MASYLPPPPQRRSLVDRVKKWQFIFLQSLLHRCCSIWYLCCHLLHRVCLRCWLYHWEWKILLLWTCKSVNTNHVVWIKLMIVNGVIQLSAKSKSSVFFLSSIGQTPSLIKKFWSKPKTKSNSQSGTIALTGVPINNVRHVLLSS